MLDELVAIAGEERHGPPPLFEKSSAYYHTPDAAYKKFATGDFCDLKVRSIGYFFTEDMWYDEEFSQEFNYYAAKLYSLITVEGTSQEGDDNGE